MLSRRVSAGSEEPRGKWAHTSNPAKTGPVLPPIFEEMSMSDYVVHLDRRNERSTSACSSAYRACEHVDERRGEGWIVRSILRGDARIDERTLRSDAIRSPRDR